MKIIQQKVGQVPFSLSIRFSFGWKWWRS